MSDGDVLDIHVADGEATLEKRRLKRAAPLAYSLLKVEGVPEDFLFPVRSDVGRLLDLELSLAGG